MIQRFIKTAIDTGLSAFSTSPDLYRELFGDVFYLSANEIASITRFFQANPIKSHQGYPRMGMGREPAYYIFEVSCQQPGFALGDQVGGIQAAADTSQAAAAAPTVGSLWDHQYQISCIAHGNIEIAYYMWEILRAILLAAKPYFMSVAMDLVALAGSEVAPNDQYEPEIIYSKTMNLRTRREFSIAQTGDELQRAFQVSGITAPPASNNTDGGALSLVSISQLLQQP